MLKWNNVLTLAAEGNLDPDREVSKTDEEWREQLSEEQFHVTRQHGTEKVAG
jgi:peptide-methionine (R)-S-oxide reductase